MNKHDLIRKVASLTGEKIVTVELVLATIDEVVRKNAAKKEETMPTSCPLARYCDTASPRLPNIEQRAQVVDALSPYPDFTPTENETTASPACVNRVSASCPRFPEKLHEFTWHLRWLHPSATCVR